MPQSICINLVKRQKSVQWNLFIVVTNGQLARDQTVQWNLSIVVTNSQLQYLGTKQYSGICLQWSLIAS